MIFSFIGCMLCLCIMAASVGGVLLSMYIVQVTADDAETLDLDNQKTARRRSSTTSTATSTPRSPATRTVSGVSSPPCRRICRTRSSPSRTRTSAPSPASTSKGTIGAALNAFTGNRIWGTNRGASTLEQQLIKNLTGDNEQDNMRKVREIFRALGLDNKVQQRETIL